MKLKEFKKTLEDFPDDLEVAVSCEEAPGWWGGGFDEVTKVIRGFDHTDGLLILCTERRLRAPERDYNKKG